MQISSCIATLAEGESLGLIPMFFHFSATDMRRVSRPMPSAPSQEENARAVEAAAERKPPQPKQEVRVAVRPAPRAVKRAAKPS